MVEPIHVMKEIKRRVSDMNTLNGVKQILEATDVLEHYIDGVMDAWGIAKEDK